MCRVVNGKALTCLLLLAALACSVSWAVVRIGGASSSGAPAVRAYQAHDPLDPVLTDRTEDLLEAGSYTVVHDGLFVAAGSEVRHYDRRALGQPPLSSWSAGTPVLAVADGPERGLVLVLERTSLSLVRFQDDAAPSLLWSYPMDESALPADPGRLIVCSGEGAYVADASVPGVRLLSIDPATPPTTVAVYSSPEGVVHDLTLWNRRLSLLTPSAFVLVDIGSPFAPSFTRLGSYVTSTRAAGADANSWYAFVADGAQLLVLDIDPASPAFLRSPPLDSWTASGPIRAVRLDKGGRAYVLVTGGYEILDVTPFGGR